jgi:hypothetical protein
MMSENGHGAFGPLASALANRYRIERELGSGGMATVYLAHDLKHDRPVALKVLRPDLAATLGAERFQREIQIAARLQHPNILPLLDSGEAAGFLYYVMPYVEGESLRDRMAREGALPVGDAVRILRDVVDALTEAHAHGVVHRDIKPENVLLRARHALVADFGVAKAVSEATGRQTLTTAGVALGTPAYMAPEQASADPKLDHRVDIYAVGAVGYEMLTGRPVFMGTTPQMVLAAHVAETPIPVSRHREAVPRALEAVVMRCLEKNPADRWQSAGELLPQLEALLTPSGGVTPTDTRPVAGVRRAHPMRTAAMVVAAAVVIGAGGLIWGMVRRRPVAAPRELERIQVTFTGNADTPALSEDGRRVAYAARQCDEDGRCTQDLVVQDVEGAGAATVVRGLAATWDIEWTVDGRYLLVSGSFGGDRWGSFSVPSLGGEPLHLSHGRVFLVGGSDTALVTTSPGGRALPVWVRWVTIADGAVHDSLPLPVTGAVGDFYAEAFPDRSRLLLTQTRVKIHDIYVVTRDGRWIDSLRTEAVAEGYPPGPRLAPDGNAILVRAPRVGAPGQFDLLAYGVSKDGHIKPEPDTLLRRLPAIGGASVAHNGTLVYAGGTVEYVLWALSRDSPSSMRFQERRLLSATGSLIGRVSPAGDRVLVGRGVPVGDRHLVQLSILPFEGGPESPLGAPQDIVDADWVQDGRSVLIGVRQGSDSMAVLRLDAVSGRSETLALLPAEAFLNLRPLPQGGLLVAARSGRELRRMGVPGLADTTFHPPEGLLQFMNFDPSPDGQEFLSAGWSVGWDSLLVHRISLSDGRATRLANLGTWEGVVGAKWLADGSILVRILETSWNQAWYRLAAAGGEPVRMGTAPRYPAIYMFSADGRRILALAEEVRSDVFIIPDFQKVLRR